MDLSLFGGLLSVLQKIKVYSKQISPKPKQASDVNRTRPQKHPIWKQQPQKLIVEPLQETIDVNILEEAPYLLFREGREVLKVLINPNTT